MSVLPLDDITVVALEQAVAAPLATRQLADLGARVIKIERPDGGDFARRYDCVVEGESSAFVWLNRGKESVQLDLKSAAGMALLHRLLDRSDVLVANLAPRALTALGLTVDALAKQHPHLIVCMISGYAPDGPMPQKKAYDALVQAECGLMALTGMPNAPAKVGISVADISAGSFACNGVLAAVRHRDRTGEVLPVQVSLFSTLTEWMGYPLYFAQHAGTAPQPMGTSHPTIAPYGTVTSADGVDLLIAVQNEREWQRLCRDVLDAPDLAVDPRFVTNVLRVQHRADLDAALARGIGNLLEVDLVERLDKAEIAWGRLNTVADLATHPELAVDDRWLDTPTPSGPVRTLKPPALPGGRGVLNAAVPALGQHTDAVLAELRDTEHLAPAVPARNERGSS